MKALRIAPLALLGAALLARIASAAIIEDFQFGDATGTVLTGAANSANAGNMWLSQEVAPIESSVQSGSYRINKVTVGGQVSNALDMANVTSGKVWLVAEIAGWSYTNTPSTTSERVRFFFLDNDPPAAGSSTVTAGMNIDRIGGGNNNLTIAGEAGGTGSTATQLSGLDLAQTRNTPLTLVLEVDADFDTYTISYKDGANPFVSMPTGSLGDRSAGVKREARSIRFAYTGTFDPAQNEFFNLDRIYVTNTNPIPEPTSFALLGFAFVMAAGSRRRCA